MNEDEEGHGLVMSCHAFTYQARQEFGSDGEHRGQVLAESHIHANFRANIFWPTKCTSTWYDGGDVED